MRSPERVIYIGGVGNEPVIQESIAELWLPHGLLVEHWPIDWSATLATSLLVNPIRRRVTSLSKRFK